jgi:hypothetical protein
VDDSGSSSEEEEEDLDNVTPKGLDGGEDDEFAPFLPEFRLIKKNDPEAYSFATPQYSAHKVPRELVDASLAGPGGMSEFMGKWQDILQNQMRQQQADSSDSE